MPDNKTIPFYELDTRHLDLDDINKPGFINGWGNLQELILHHSLERAGGAEWVVQFIQRAPKLQKLDLDFDTGEGTPEVLSRLAYGNSYPRLRELRFTTAACLSGEDLLAFLRQSRGTLCSLHLRYISLRTLSWRKILTVLKDEFTALKSIRFLWLGGGSEGVLHFPILSQNPFVNNHEDVDDRFAIFTRYYLGQCRNLSVDYSGPNMQAALGALLDTAQHTVQDS
ncbi:uncharacterized protein ATNIH1004_001634 [Aspergillus tanneri]|uniref:F-box domain-containing protein n=1 Tax=Aspergillus tanneri TaxID=1220188 RepID=A0A5M9N6J8_9EURO|nr:uncharacterized protein ATNIH1004_001634 [Aspergillus tanneri]KAA8652729.1 hypothetical protein ATNIH1004_001634 [Aspergillus tanneri]